MTRTRLDEPKKFRGDHAQFSDTLSMLQRSLEDSVYGAEASIEKTLFDLDLESAGDEADTKKPMENLAQERATAAAQECFAVGFSSFSRFS